MRPETGRVIRRVAYTLEVICLFGLLVIGRNRPALHRIAGLDERQWLTAGLALGITLWVIGTVIMLWPRRTPEKPEP